MPRVTPYEHGHAAGYAEAVEREHRGDATAGDDHTTWFSMPAGEPDLDATEYERGWAAGWHEHLTAH